MNQLHIGQRIKLIVENRGITVSEFAKRINKSRENIYSIYSRKTIDTGLLSVISDVLQFDFFLEMSTTTYELNAKIEKLEEENTLLKEYNNLLKSNKNDDLN